jgi:hypothetical protein
VTDAAADDADSDDVDHDEDVAEAERIRRAAERLPQNVPPRGVFLAIAAIFTLGVIIGFVLGRTT